MNQIIINYLSKLELGELQTFKNMAIIPLFSSLNHTPQYLSLGEAMGKGLLTVTEVSQAGAVPELKVVNRADLPVLLWQTSPGSGGLIFPERQNSPATGARNRFISSSLREK